MYLLFMDWYLETSRLQYHYGIAKLNRYLHDILQVDNIYGFDHLKEVLNYIAFCWGKLNEIDIAWLAMEPKITFFWSFDDVQSIGRYIWKFAFLSTWHKQSVMLEHLACTLLEHYPLLLLLSRFFSVIWHTNLSFNFALNN